MQQNDDKALRAPAGVGEYRTLSSGECEHMAGFLCSSAGRTGRWRNLISHLTALEARMTAAATEEAELREQSTLEEAQRILARRGSSVKIV